MTPLTPLHTTMTTTSDNFPATIADVRQIVGSLRDEGPAGPQITLDWSTSTAKRITITEPCFITFENGRPGMPYVVELEHDHAGPAIVDWPASVVWATVTRSAPALSAGRNVRDILVFYCDGCDYIGTEHSRGLPLARRV